MTLLQEILSSVFTLKRLISYVVPNYRVTLTHLVHKIKITLLSKENKKITLLSKENEGILLMRIQIAGTSLIRFQQT
jgi:hypothetical protein